MSQIIITTNSGLRYKSEKFSESITETREGISDILTKIQSNKASTLNINTENGDLLILGPAVALGSTFVITKDNLEEPLTQANI